MEGTKWWSMQGATCGGKAARDLQLLIAEAYHVLVLDMFGHQRLLERVQHVGCAPLVAHDLHSHRPALPGACSTAQPQLFTFTSLRSADILDIQRPVLRSILRDAARVQDRAHRSSLVRHGSFPAIVKSAAGATSIGGLASL